MLRCGAVLPSIKTRLDAAIIAVFPDRVVSQFVLADRDLKPFLQQALVLATVKPFVIQNDDAAFDGPRAEVDTKGDEALLTEGDPGFAWMMPEPSY
jgi:fatty-acyl-CoA synthase